jgi:hypothetical protein
MGEAGGTADRPVDPPGIARRIWRIVDGPAGLGDVASLAEALLVADDGDVVECAFSGVRDEEPCVLVGRRLTLRAAPGHDPVLRFTIPVGDGTAAGLSVVSGTFAVEGVGLRLFPASARGSSSRGASLFALGRGTTLTVDNALLEIREPQRAAGGIVAAGGDAVFVRVGHPDGKGAREGITLLPGAGAGAREGGAALEAVVRLSGVQAVGEGTFLAAERGTSMEIGWSGGRCVTGGRFLRIDGGPRAGPATSVRLALRDTVLANQEGFALLVDSPADPTMPNLRVSAERCRFLTPPGLTFIEQSGIGQPDAYRAAVEWNDAGGRYEGATVFRRIDGAAEREEIPFTGVSPTLRHEPSIGGWSEGNLWDFPAMLPADAPRRPDS